MARDTDQYRSMGTTVLLRVAREEGIDAEMAVAMAERLEVLEYTRWNTKITNDSMGGRYTFNRSAT